MNDWAIIWFWGRLHLSSKTNMAATPLTGQDAAKKLSFTDRKQTLCCTNVPVRLQWSFKKVDKRFPLAAWEPEVEMSCYWFNGRTVQDADLHLPHLFSLCPFTVTELMSSIDQWPSWAWREGARGQTEGQMIAKNLSVSLSVYLSAYPSVYPFICLSIYLHSSVHPSIPVFHRSGSILAWGGGTCSFDLHIFCMGDAIPPGSQVSGEGLSVVQVQALSHTDCMQSICKSSKAGPLHTKPAPQSRKHTSECKNIEK